MDDPVDTRLASRFRVGDWVADPDTGRLQRQDEEVKLEPKAMQVLVYLAENQGKVVSREALEAAAWAGMIVGYDAVSGSIIKLRKALGDNSRNPQYIETVSKKGYRLIAPVSTDVAEPKSVSVSTQHSSTVKTDRSKLLFPMTGVLLGLGLLFYLVSGTDTEKSTGVTSAQAPSVVVMPFKNLSDDPRQEYFSDGITDDLITDLSRVESLRVIAPQTSYYYKNNPVGLEEVARQLGVLYIVEGSVRKSGSHIRINVQLTNTSKGVSIWANRFETDEGDIFKIQDAITRDVMDAMVLTLSDTGMDDIRNRGTRNFEAYDAFLLGQKYIKTRTKQGYEQTMNAYRRAIEIDPNYARAYGAMAVTLTRGYRYQWTDLSPPEAKARALELANKAVELNQSSPHIFWSLAYVHLHRHEFAAAEIAVETAIKLSPNFSDGYALLANIANWRGKASEAVGYINKAMSLNPYYSFQYPSTLGLSYYSLGRYQEAVNVLKDAVERNESALNPHLFLAASYVRLGNTGEAEWEVEQISTNRPDTTLSSLSTSLPFEHDDALQPLLDDLKKAGLPE
ncbi:winged helix-turn-helix domain-containing tetratricopeptide repeat protein [Kaarinaea lacus]